MYNDEFNSYHFTNRDDLPRDDYTPTPRPQPELTPTPSPTPTTSICRKN